MQRDSEFLATERPSKLLLKLALPAVTAQLVNMLYNIVDRMYIGRLEGIGTEALAGVGACMPVILLVSAFAALASMGGAPRASIFMGRGDRESAERTMGNCMTLLLALAAVLAALPPQTGEDIYRLLLTGERGLEGLDLGELERELSPRFWGLTLRDHTRAARALWERKGEDTLTGLFLREMEGRCQAEPENEAVQLAVRFGLAALEHGEDVAL